MAKHKPYGPYSENRMSKKRNMKQFTFLLMAVVCGSWLCSACGSNDKEAKQTDTTAIFAAPQANLPQTNVRYPELLDTVRIGASVYACQILTKPDETLPIFVDNQDQEFYQNRVTVRVTRDGQEVISRSFVKDDFSKYCVASLYQDFEAGMLEGMSLNREGSEAGRLCFWAVVGWCGEGPTFRVYIQPGSNQVSIEQEVNNVDNSMPDEMM